MPLVMFQSALISLMFNPNRVVGENYILTWVKSDKGQGLFPLSLLHSRFSACRLGIAARTTTHNSMDTQFG